MEFAIPKNEHVDFRVDFKREWDQLLKVVVVRQFYYQTAWLLAICAWTLLAIFIGCFGL